MQSTTFEHWWPVTHEFGLIHATLEAVGPIREKQYKDSDLKSRTTWLSGSLAECFSLLEPLSPAPEKELFLATTFGWTAYFSNGARGSDPFLPMFQLSKALGVTALHACVTRNNAHYPATILGVYDTPQMGGDENGYRRSIVAANDGGRWVFEQSGTPYSFEETAKYSARRKRDRFTPDMLWSYLNRLGIPRLSDETLQTRGRCKGLLLARPTHDNLPSYTLAEAKDL
jgi:hypothetical protein